MKRKEIERRWELERKMVIIPTVRELMKKEKLSLEEAAKRSITICGEEHKKNNIDCHRKLNGFDLCDDCPKYQQEKRELTWLEWHPPKEYLVSKRR
jgi:hypothetical protein